MDVFSLLKFWRNAGVGDPTAAADFDFFSDDEESFFDLELTNNDNGDSPTVDAIRGFHSDHYQAVSKADGADSKSHSTYSPNDALFLNNKRKILPLDSSNLKTPRSPFRVLLLGFQNNNKSKLEKTEMKCEIEEVRIGSLLKRDNSLRNKLRTEKLLDDQMPSKRFSKDVVNKYLNLIKPLYVKVSKRSVQSPEQYSVTPSSSPAFSSAFSPRKEEKRGRGSGAMFREVRKHLGKSRSFPTAAVRTVQTPASRTDDSMLEQQAGIQSAILHCKKSFSSPSQGGCCVLSRSGSAPSHSESNNQPRISICEEKRNSI